MATVHSHTCSREEGQFKYFKVYLFKGKSYVMLGVVFFTLLLGVFGKEVAKITIINSTKIEDFKMHLLPEERSGSVMYVYARSGSADLPDPEKSEELNPLNGMLSVNGTGPLESKNTTDSTQVLPIKVFLESTNSTADNSTDTNEKYCIVRVDEDDTIKYYQGTMEELRAMGKNVLDLLCEGDSGPELKALSKGALYSLVGG